MGVFKNSLFGWFAGLVVALLSPAVIAKDLCPLDLKIFLMDKTSLFSGPSEYEPKGQKFLKELEAFRNRVKQEIQTENSLDPVARALSAEGEGEFWFLKILAKTYDMGLNPVPDLKNFEIEFNPPAGTTIGNYLGILKSLNPETKMLFSFKKWLENNVEGLDLTNNFYLLPDGFLLRAKNIRGEFDFTSMDGTHLVPHALAFLEAQVSKTHPNNFDELLWSYRSKTQDGDLKFRGLIMESFLNSLIRTINDLIFLVETSKGEGPWSSNPKFQGILTFLNAQIHFLMTQEVQVTDTIRAFESLLQMDKKDIFPYKYFSQNKNYVLSMTSNRGTPENPIKPWSLVLNVDSAAQNYSDRFQISFFGPPGTDKAYYFNLAHFPESFVKRVQVEMLPLMAMQTGQEQSKAEWESIFQTLQQELLQVLVSQRRRVEDQGRRVKMAAHVLSKSLKALRESDPSDPVQRIGVTESLKKTLKILNSGI